MPFPTQQFCRVMLTFAIHFQPVYYGTVAENDSACRTVLTVTATDADDPKEGSNAKIKYSIRTNAIEEITGAPIFDIDENTGVIRTAICCLNREHNTKYSLQVKTKQ